MATHKQRVLKKLGLPKDSSLSLSDLSKYFKIPVEGLQEVYNRGVGAWKTNPTSVRLKGTFTKDPTKPRQARISKEAWGYARIYSFINKGKTFETADADIAKKYNIG